MTVVELNDDRIRSKAARLRRIEQRLYNSPQGLRVTDIARDCGVDRRTIYRDLMALEEMGVPVWEQRSRFGIDRAAYLSTVRLNLHEAVSIFFAARLLAHHSDEHNPHIVAALDKLAASLPEGTISAHMARLAELVRSRPVRVGYIRALEELTRAWADRKLVKIRYRAPNREAGERVIAPYFIEVSRSTPAAYVIAYDQLRQGLRTFKIERIERAELLDESYIIPASFDPYDYLSRSWGVMDEAEVEVRLRFSLQAANRVRESLWHHTQQLIEREDGGCDMLITVGGTREICPWVLGWGAEVEVLAPSELREEVAGHGARMRELYQA